MKCGAVDGKDKQLYGSDLWAAGDGARTQDLQPHWL